MVTARLQLPSVTFSGVKWKVSFPGGKLRLLSSSRSAVGELMLPLAGSMRLVSHWVPTHSLLPWSRGQPLERRGTRFRSQLPTSAQPAATSPQTLGVLRTSL